MGARTPGRQLGAHATRESACSRAPALKQFGQGMFDRFKLESFELKFENFKNKSCRSCVRFQLLYRSTYGILHGLGGKSTPTSGFSRLGQLCALSFDCIFEVFALRI
jgi:hypothetical protein